MLNQTGKSYGSQSNRMDGDLHSELRDPGSQLSNGDFLIGSDAFI